MHELSTPYSFFDKGALAAVGQEKIKVATVVRALKLIETVRDVADGTAAILSMAINVNIRESSDGDCQVSSTDMFRLQTLCQRTQEMLAGEATRLINSVNEDVRDYGKDGDK